MSKIGGVINIVVGIIIVFVGGALLKDHFVGAGQKIEKLEVLLSDGVETVGLVDSVYKEVKIKSVRIYTGRYTINVDDKKYTNDFYFDSPSTLEPFVKVLYMPNDPSISEANVEKELAKLKEREDSSINMWGGIIAIIIGLFYLYFRGVRRFTHNQTQT